MKVSIPDDVYELYERAAAPTGRPADQIITEQLVVTAPFPPGSVHLTLDQSALEKLAAKLGGGTIFSAADLILRVYRLAGIRFHRIDLDFTPNQLAELEHRSERQGVPVETLIQRMVKKFGEEMFWRSGGEEARVLSTPPPVQPPVPPAKGKRRAGA